MAFRIAWGRIARDEDEVEAVSLARLFYDSFSVGRKRRCFWEILCARVALKFVRNSRQIYTNKSHSHTHTHKHIAGNDTQNNSLSLILYELSTLFYGEKKDR